MTGAHRSARQAETTVESRHKLAEPKFGGTRALPVLVFSAPPEEVYRRCRGEAAFNRWESQGYRVLTEGGSLKFRGDEYIGDPLYIFTGTPASAGIVELITAVARRPDCAVIVDITWPFTTRDIKSLVTHLHVTDEDMAERLSVPEVEHHIIAGLQAADAVSVSRRSWSASKHFIKTMGDYNDHVFLLPDISERVGHLEVISFQSTLMRQWKNATRRKGGIP